MALLGIEQTNQPPSLGLPTIPLLAAFLVFNTQFVELPQTLRFWVCVRLTLPSLSLPLLNFSCPWFLLEFSTPGNDFRPDYKKLGILKQQFPDTPIIALTATATLEARCCLPACMPACPPACLPARLPARLPACLPASLLCCLITHQPHATLLVLVWCPLPNLPFRALPATIGV
jgi:hypothetical protein